AVDTLHFGDGGLDTHGMDAATRTGFRQRRPKKGSLLVVAFHQMDPTIPQLSKKDCRNDAGKAAATPQIQPDYRLWAHLKYLRRISDMPFPEGVHSRGCDQIDGFRPLVEQTRKMLEPLHCFT